MEGHRPKSLILILLWQEHRAALQYDWIHAWNKPLDLKTFPLYAAWPMCREILRHHDTNTYAALAGWSHIPDPADKYMHALNQSASKHHKAKAPWERADPLAGPNATPDRTPKRDERLRSKLKTRLGIHE